MIPSTNPDDYIVIRAEKVDEAAPSRLPGYKDAIIKASVVLMKEKDRKVVGGYRMLKTDFAAIKAKFNPEDKNGSILTDVVLNASTAESLVDVRTIMSKQIFKPEEYPILKLNSDQVKGRVAYLKKLDGRDEAACPGCELSALKTRITRAIVDSADTVPTSVTIITLWRGTLLNALSWYAEETFPDGCDIVWIDDGIEPTTALYEFKDAHPELQITIKRPESFTAASAPLRIAKLYDIACEERFLGDIILTVGDDIIAKKGTLAPLKDRFNDHKIGNVSAYYTDEKHGDTRTCYTEVVPWRNSYPLEVLGAEIDVTDGVAMMGFHMFRKLVWTESQPFIYPGRGAGLGNDTRLHATTRNLGMRSLVLSSIEVQHVRPC